MFLLIATALIPGDDRRMSKFYYPHRSRNLMEIYRWLLRENDLPVADTGCFVYHK